MKLSEMLQPKAKRKIKIQVRFIRVLRDKSLLYENIKTKTMYIKENGIFYNMKHQVVNYDIEEI